MTKPTGPGFTVLYRWRVHPDKEQQFIDAWSRITALLRDHGSEGSRLHRAADGLWYSYAQWPSAAARERAFAQLPSDSACSAAMRDAITDTLPEVVLETVADFLVLPQGHQAGPSVTVVADA